MITKERLEALIEQGATIYAVNSYKKDVEELELNCNLDAVNAGVFMKYNIEQWLHHLYLFDSLFETKEDAEWELEMTATRTEVLKLPNWEEFIQNDKQIIFYIKDKTYYLDKVMNKTHIVIGYKCIMDFIEELEANRYNLYRKPLTKENYIEACKLCLRLFKGEEV